jgi:hypothetical protein
MNMLDWGLLLTIFLLCILAYFLFAYVFGETYPDGYPYMETQNDAPIELS